MSESCRRLLKPRFSPTSWRVGTGVVMVTERAMTSIVFDVPWRFLVLSYKGRYSLLNP
jgi:hypothetical protein